MSNPYLYLKDEKMKGEIDSIHDALPDISIAFKLFAQCGNMINLADWLGSGYNNTRIYLSLGDIAYAA